MDPRSEHMLSVYRAYYHTKEVGRYLTSHEEAIADIRHIIRSCFADYYNIGSTVIGQIEGEIRPDCKTVHPSTIDHSRMIVREVLPVLKGDLIADIAYMVHRTAQHAPVYLIENAMDMMTILHSYKMNAAAKMMYIWMCWKGRSWYTQQMIAEGYDIGKRMVREYLYQLIKAGLVKRDGYDGFQPKYQLIYVFEKAVKTA